MVRQPISSWNKMFLKKGTWSPEEDKKLIAYITRYGIWNWNEMPKYAGLSRSGKSCRLRWMNYLRPDIRRGNFIREEEETIVRMQKMIGNRWSAIAAMLPQRTDNDIKNYWNTRLKKRVENSASASASPTETTSSIEVERENSFLELDSPIPVSGNFSESPSVSSYTAVVDNAYTMEDNNFDLSPMYGKLHSLLDNEDFQAMSPTSQLWLHEPIYLHDSFYDPVEDFWVSPFI